MGLFGGSKHSTTNTTQNYQNTSGTAAAQGDNNGAQISGVVDSTVNVTTTDHGAVKMAGDVLSDALAAMSQSTNSTLDSIEGVSKGAFDAIEGNNKSAFDAIAQSNNSAFDAIEGSNKSAFDAISKTNENAFDFAGDTLEKILENNEHVFDKSLESVNSSVAVTKDLAMQTSANSKTMMGNANDMLDKFLSTSENLMTGGQSQQTKSNTAIMLSLLLVIGVVGGIYAYKGK